jgi:hypothetical protein
MTRAGDVVVDVSNVCWAPTLPPVGRSRPIWSRLGLVLDAWRAARPSARIWLVADDSLVRSLDDVGEYRQLLRSGELETRQVADQLVLELARDQGLDVITRDHYVDHRDEHPWIESAPQRFHQWTLTNGKVGFEPLGITAVSRQLVSQARERKDLKLARFNPASPRDRTILRTRWRCANVICEQSAQWQGHLLVWPAMDRRGMAVCPSCRKPLTDLGPRSALREVVVSDVSTDEVLLRFPLEEGCPVHIGREPRLKGVDLGSYVNAATDAVIRVSRRHALLAWERQGGSDHVTVTDLGSANGTAVARWTGDRLAPAKAVHSGEPVAIGFTDRIILGGTIEIRLSGKKYLTDIPDNPAGQRRDDGTPPATTVISR